MKKDKIRVLKSRYYKILFKIIRNGTTKANIIKKANIFHNIGNNCKYYCSNLPSEPFLVSFGNNVVVAADVKFFTHDVINNVFNGMNDGNNYKFYMGKIVVGNNVFIGANSIILPNVEIGNNVIIGAGSVITKNIEEGKIVAGNPARIIGETKNIKQRRMNLSEMPSNRDSMVKINNYFWKEQFKR